VLLPRRSRRRTALTPYTKKPLHEYSEQEFSRYALPPLENYVLNGRVPRD
jgi:hypothetical protein